MQLELPSETLQLASKNARSAGFANVNAYVADLIRRADDGLPEISEEEIVKRQKAAHERLLAEIAKIELQESPDELIPSIDHDRILYGDPPL